MSIIHLHGNNRKIRAIALECNKIVNSGISSGLATPVIAKKLTRFLQNEYDTAFSALDLSAVPIPDRPGQFQPMNILGYHLKRFNVTIDCEVVSLSLRLVRLCPKGRKGPSHTVFPWFLCPWTRDFLIECVTIVKAIRKSRKEARSLHALALDLAISFWRLRRLDSLDRLFLQAVRADTLDLYFLITLSFRFLHRTWLQRPPSGRKHPVLTGLAL